MKKIISISIFIFCLYACKKDFIVKDITKGTITINSPANNLVTTSNLITFWWEELDGAEKYNIQIVKPGFQNMIKLVADTSVTDTKFNLSLDPGTYQWRIRATNAGGNSAFQTFNLTVDTTSNLSNLLVYPVLPVNGNLTGNTSVTFSWVPLMSATYYQLEINNGSVLSTTASGNTFSYTVPALSGTNTAFTWRIKAFNNFSFTQFNSPYNFTVDLAPPVAPVLISPANGFTVKDTIKLVWSRVGAPDAVSDSVFVATDSLFTNIISETRTWQLSTKINQLNNPPNINNTIYWWRLRSVDSAGNRSAYSSQMKFKLSYP